MIKRMSLWRCLWSITLAAVVVCGASQAQEAEGGTPSEDLQVSTMTLGGHSFSPTSFLADPFIRTFARTSMGFGFTPNLEIPLVEIGGERYSWNSGQLIYSLLQFEFQAALREWLAFDAQVEVTGRLADETIPLLSQGVVLITGYELGALFNVHQTEAVTVALSAGATSAGLTDVNVGRFISALIDTGAITPDNSLVTSTPSVRAFAGLRLAYGINDLLGFLVQGNVSYGEAPQRRSSDQWFGLFAAVLDLNLSKRWNTPIGFGIGFKVNSNPGGSSEVGQTITSVLGHISYVGARDFNLGLDLSDNLVPVRSLPEKASFFAAEIDMRLVF